MKLYYEEPDLLLNSQFIKVWWNYLRR